jgi:hypothetical protein
LIHLHQPRQAWSEEVVVFRKGELELSQGTIDRDWPHQVALAAARCGGADYVTIRLFCEDEKLSLCVRGHSFRRGDADMIVFCFAERTHAHQFRDRFGGEFIDPKSPQVAQFSPPLTLIRLDLRDDTRPSRPG